MNFTIPTGLSKVEVGVGWNGAGSGQNRGGWGMRGSVLACATYACMLSLSLSPDTLLFSPHPQELMQGDLLANWRETKVFSPMVPNILICPPPTIYSRSKIYTFWHDCIGGWGKERTGLNVRHRSSAKMVFEEWKIQKQIFNICFWGNNHDCKTATTWPH